MRTKEVAQRAQVNVQTLRYYERRGLLDRPPRTPAGYRDYPHSAVHLLRFVKRAQELGFSLADIEGLLHLADGGPDSCDRVRAMAAQKMADLERRIADLQALHGGLARLVETCERPRSERDCPILHELGADGQP
jgi:Hg(II)-responsive transcriptional regulator